ncbi:hypothetical protein BCR36DRAFT_346479 [Piromyces finnis]|uniref:Uncharacterized protein n=1 Tax=Piromyces finnis TaxID=1754191 RepID=A0A1Y1VGY7_9FUNG|nr:hypothetical protein BCR36DRAFT_346479 [Piromyces finnis]|eukprot:ORX55995.1 hypothetical protein BCR36DRAFT_346479 [Piromyces finnis]
MRDVPFTIKLDQAPKSPINITFVSENNFQNFDVSPKFIYFDKGIDTIELDNNTILPIQNDNLTLSKTFTLKNKHNGRSTLSFDIQSGDNIKLDEFLGNKLDITVNTFSISNIIIIIATAMFLFSIGLSLSGNTLRGTFHKDRLPSMFCGLFCQFILVPVISFFIPKIFKQRNYQAFSVFMVGISPSSVIAPIFTYYLGGDRALAVSLCLLSTILGSGIYVLYIWLYTFIFSSDLQINEFPYKYMAFIIIYCLVPFLLGSLLLHFKPLWANWIKKSTTFWGAIIIITSLVMSLKDFSVIFYKNWEIYCVSIVLSSISFIISLIMTKIFNLDDKKTIAVCMNTILPNIPLAITIIQVYLTPCCAQVLSAFPLFHTFWMLIEAIIIGAIMHLSFPVIETINETSEQELSNLSTFNNNINNNNNNNAGLTIITPKPGFNDDKDNDDKTETKINNIINSNNKQKQKHESYHKKKISNSTVGLIGKDENDPNIEYLDEVTSIGDEDSITSDTNIGNLVIPTTFSKDNYTISKNSNTNIITDNNYLSPNSIVTSEVLVPISHNNNNNNNNINITSNLDKPKYIKHKANDSTVLDNIKKSDIDIQYHKRSYSYQVNFYEAKNKENENTEDSPTGSPELLKVNDINTFENRFSPGGSPVSGTPSITSMGTKATKKCKTKSIANTYISNTTTLRPNKSVKVKTPEEETNNNMSPNFNVNDAMNLSMVSESTQNSTVIQGNKDNTPKMTKPSLESIISKSDSLYSAVESATSNNSISSSSFANTTINLNNLNNNSLLLSDTGNSYLKKDKDINIESNTTNNNISLASMVFNMPVSQAVSCFPEPIKIDLKNKEKEEIKNDNSILSPVSINSKFSFDSNSITTNNIDNPPLTPSRLEHILDELNKEQDNENKGKLPTKSNLLKSSFINKHNMHDHSSINNVLSVDIPKKPYSTKDSNEINSANTFCTTKTNFSSPSSSNNEHLIKDAGSKLKQSEGFLSPPLIHNSIDTQKSYISPYQTPQKSLTGDSLNYKENNSLNKVNHHRYKSSTTSFFNSLDDSVDFQSYTDSMDGMEIVDLTNISHSGINNNKTQDVSSIATSNKHSSFASALTNPFINLNIQSTVEPDEYIIPQRPEMNVDNNDIDYNFNPQRVSVMSAMSYTTFKSCQTEISEYHDCVENEQKK